MDDGWGWRLKVGLHVAAGFPSVVHQRLQFTEAKPWSLILILPADELWYTAAYHH